MPTPVHTPVRVVTVVFNPGDELRRFVASLAIAAKDPVELVIVNNGAECAIVTRMAERGVTVLRHVEGNVGYGRAVNLGAAGSTGDWIIVANPDIEWAPGSLDTLLAAGAAAPGAGSVGPRILNEDGTVYPSARALPSLATGVGHAVFHTIWPANPWSKRYRRAGQADAATAPLSVGWLSGACLAVRRSAWEQIGGFDERYFMFFEDTDLGDRLAKAGWNNLYIPDAVVTHVQGVSWKSAPVPMIRAHHASARRYLFDRWGAWWQWPIRMALGAGLSVREQVEVRRARREHQSKAE